MVPAIADLLAEVRRREVRLEVAGRKIRYTPHDGLTPELIDRLKQHRADVIATLGPVPQPCPACGSAIFWLAVTGETTCIGCVAKPAEAVRKLLIVTINDKNQWADFETELALIRGARIASA
jgi:hypothetical protein